MKNKKPLISIIVPIYNAEDYLQDCLSSIAAQSYKNIEAILINDGSTDNSYNIAQSFCDKDPRFKLISQPNGGVGAARQAGLNAVTGEYIIHTDSDDLMTDKALEYLYQSIEENNSNVAVGAYVNKTRTGDIVVEHSSNSKNDFIVDILLGKCHGSLWNKLISAELCKDLYFNNNINYMEDILFLMKVLANKKTVLSVTNEVVYIYNFVEGSYTNSISTFSIESSIIVTREICNIFSDIYSEEFISHLKNRNKVMVLLNSDFSQRNVFPESYKHLISDNLLPLKHKLIVFLDYIYLNFIINLYRKI